MVTSTEFLQVSANCTRCGIHLTAPEWSERIGGAETVHIWHCPWCGNEFETVDDSVTQTVSDEESIRDQFANLLVA